MLFKPSLKKRSSLFLVSSIKNLVMLKMGKQFNNIDSKPEDVVAGENFSFPETENQIKMF